MKKHLFLCLLTCCLPLMLTAQNTVVDFHGDNTDKDYITYDKAISVAEGKAVDVKMARYCYFNSTVSGRGTVNLYTGGERCWLGTKSAWANWSSFRGDAHIYPYRENSTKAGAFLVVLHHGGKTFSPGNIDDCIKSGKLNNALQNCRVTVHSGAGLCNEANNQNAGGFRIGELQMEQGSTLQGYMKNSRTSYYLVGNLNGDATLAGTIAPSKNDDATLLGLIKEGTGTYRITGNNNYMTGALRIVGGRLLVNNDRAEAESKKLSGGVGARPNENEAIVYVFSKGTLGGNGSIGGSVDNYGTIEPGDASPATLTLRNYATPTRNAHLTLHPASVLRFKIASADSYDRLEVSGSVKYSNATEDFATSDKQAVVTLVLPNNFTATAGTELTLLTAKSKSGDWQFRLQQPGKGTWELQETTDADGYKLLARLTATTDADPNAGGDDQGSPETPASTMGAYYDDGIADASDSHTLRYYAEKNQKLIGVALSTYKGLASERDECGRQFNLMVAENEMKMDALQPTQGQFSWGSADQLVSHAQKNNMAVRGHCLVWHMQQPAWLSSDGKKNDKKWTRQEALDIMKTHITTVMKHFKGKVTEWDVVNECLDDAQEIVLTDPDGYKLRPTVWQQAIGDDYIDSAFVYARRADPSVVLYLNDYDVEQQGIAKAVAFRNLVKHLQTANIPIDGVGLQCHFTVGQVDSVKLARTFESFAQAGLKCVITELDMGIPSTTSANLEEQARLYRVVTDIMLNNPCCPYMVVWGAKDNDSWRSGSSPLLYDSGLGKKKAWYAVRSALRHRAIVNEQTGILQALGDSSRYAVRGPRYEDGPVYELRGTRIYIQNGKKFFINPLNQLNQ